MNTTLASDLKGFKLLHVNIRSLYKKLEKVQLLYNKFDIIMCSESCIYGISAEILKHAFQKIPYKIQLLFQRSLVSGVFPRKWAIGYVNNITKIRKFIESRKLETDYADMSTCLIVRKNYTNSSYENTTRTWSY